MPETERVKKQIESSFNDRVGRQKNNTKKSRELYTRLLKGFERAPNTLLVSDRGTPAALDCGRAFDRSSVTINMLAETVHIGDENGHDEDVISTNVIGFKTNNNIFAYSGESMSVYFRKHAIARFAEREYEAFAEFDIEDLRKGMTDAVLMANLMRFDYSHHMKNVPVPCGDGLLLGYDIRGKNDKTNSISSVFIVENGKVFLGEARGNGYPSKTYFNTHLGVADLSYDQLTLRDRLAEFIEKHRETMIDLMVYAKFGMAKNYFGVSADCIYEMMAVTEELDQLKASPEWLSLGTITRKGVLQTTGIEARKQMRILYGGQARNFSFHEPLVNRRQEELLSKLRTEPEPIDFQMDTAGGLDEAPNTNARFPNF